MTSVSCVVLAGGQSTRMGVEKAFLDILGRPMIEWTLAGLTGLGQETIIVTNNPEPYRHLGTRVVTDLFPGQGALGGLYTGLHHAQEELAVVVACDMPFLNRGLLAYQVGLAGGFDAVVPRIGRYMEPLHAVYARSCLEPIGALLRRGGQRFFDFFSAIRLRYVEQDEIERFDPEHRSFVNVNTPADLESIRRLAAQILASSPSRAAQ